MRVEVIVRDGVELRVDTCVGCGHEFTQVRKPGRPLRRCDTCSGRAAPKVEEVGHRVAGDPPVRDDGLCACGCGKQRKLTQQARRYAGVQLDLDPFASTECCKAFYGVVFSTADEEDPERAEQRRRGGMASAAGFRDRHRFAPGSGVFAR